MGIFVTLVITIGTNAGCSSKPAGSANAAKLFANALPDDLPPIVYSKRMNALKLSLIFKGMVNMQLLPAAIFDTKNVFTPERAYEQLNRDPFKIVPYPFYSDTPRSSAVWYLLPNPLFLHVNSVQLS